MRKLGRRKYGEVLVQVKLMLDEEVWSYEVW